ncbi:hypothetical protein FISHEDRAFT_76927 [Fistulina hepatica ATCC 64428]|uniref:Uncharacterized protein n=1 Tax=Fistulina hepatica ATCC 64428 TaxID=1128425 RepID=A0A0D7A3X3_9AGAR|nr:hypothetical protein FISHEDRAFT_76927 [Fistulina hepatica ATCC 64428]
MSSTTPSIYFRRRVGRCPSPPTWACYEQIFDDEDDYSDSGSDGCSEDDEDYPRDILEPEHLSDHDEDTEHGGQHLHEAHDDDIDMDVDEDSEECRSKKATAAGTQKDVKGKQRAIEPEPLQRRQHKRRQRERARTLRPILTIQRSQGFVWNQDLFVPPYIKDRYIASTSPPMNTGSFASSLSSTYSGLNDYEIEVVEIRVREGELNNIIP